MNYRHWSSEERYYIEIERKKGKSFTKTCKIRDRHKNKKEMHLFFPRHMDRCGSTSLMY